MKRLFDTNILIDYLNGIEAAQAEIEHSGERYISIITWMELLAGSHDDAEEDVIDLFLRDFRVIDISRRTAREAVQIRRSRRITLTDSVIWATARVESAVLVTRNTTDFPEADLGIRVPYQVTAESRPSRKVSARRKASR